MSLDTPHSHDLPETQNGHQNGHQEGLALENDAEESFAMGAELIETTDEDGNVHIFEKVDEYEVDNHRYALLIYQGGDELLEASEEAGEDGDDEEIVIMRITTEEGADVFEAIEDDEEFQRVVQLVEKSGFSEDGLFDLAKLADHLSGPEHGHGHGHEHGEHQHGPGCQHHHHHEGHEGH